MSQSGGIHQNPSHREGNNHLLRLVRHYESSLKSGHPFYFDVEDLEEIADYYIADGRASDGEAVVELGLKMHPCSSGLLLRRVRVLMVSGQLQRALRLLDSMPDASYVSSDVDALLTKGEILVRLSRVFEAEQVFEECVEAVRRGGNLEEYIDTCLTVSDIYIADSLYTCDCLHTPGAGGRRGLSGRPFGTGLLPCADGRDGTESGGVGASSVAGSVLGGGMVQHRSDLRKSGTIRQSHRGIRICCGH